LAKKVLIVDDKPGGVAPLRELMKQSSLTVFEATSGRQALETHRREHVDLIVMDLQMRGMDGEQVTRTIRADAALRDVSILLFSDSPRPGLRQRCLASGANEFVSKPFHNPELMNRVWQLLNVATRKRTGLLAHVDVTDGGPPVLPFVARIVNVSTSGLALEADVPITEGRTVAVKFFVPGNNVQLTATGTIIRRAETAGAVRWGVRFTALDLNARRIIRDYVGG
jgi:CheY-like chemotaxis protein